MAYTPFVTMPLDILSLQLEVMECAGIHLTFPYGDYNNVARRKNFKNELYDGLIYRVFFYSTDPGTTTIVRAYYSSSWYIKTYAIGFDRITWSASAVGGEVNKQDYQPQQAFTGGFCSLGIEIDGNNFRAICNRVKSPSKNMKAIGSYQWEYCLETANSYIISTHVYFENKSKVPGNGLGTRYKSLLITPGFGTFAVYDLVYKGGDKKLYLTFFQGETNETSGYVDINLSNNSEFTLYILNVPSGYLIHTSYVNTVQLIQRKGTLNYDAPAFSDNIYIRRGVVENGFGAA